MKQAYYLEPEKVGVKPYYLLKKSLQEMDKVAVGKIALRDREHMATLRPYDKGMVVNTLHWPDEIRSMDDLNLPEEEVKIDKREMAMAKMLIENLSDEFDPERYVDEYREALLKVARAKAEGHEIEVVEAAPQPKVMDLMAALKASVEASKKGGGKAADSDGHAARPRPSRAWSRAGPPRRRWRRPSPERASPKRRSPGRGPRAAPNAQRPQALAATGCSRMMPAQTELPLEAARLPEMVLPMFPGGASEPFDSREHLFEVRWDGLRALAFVEGGGYHLQDQSGRNITELFPELGEISRRLAVDECIVDGVVVVCDADGKPDFAALDRRMRIASADGVAQAAERQPAAYIIFDILYAGTPAR